MTDRLPPSPIAVLADGLAEVVTALEDAGYALEDSHGIQPDVLARIHDLKELETRFINALKLLSAGGVAEVKA